MSIGRGLPFEMSLVGFSLPSFAELSSASEEFRFSPAARHQRCHGLAAVELHKVAGGEDGGFSGGKSCATSAGRRLPGLAARSQPASISFLCLKQLPQLAIIFPPKRDLISLANRHGSSSGKPSPIAITSMDPRFC